MAAEAAKIMNMYRDEFMKEVVQKYGFLTDAIQVFLNAKIK